MCQYYLSPRLSVCLARSPSGYSLDFPFLRCIEQLLVSEGPDVNPVSGSDPERNRIIDYSAEVDGLTLHGTLGKHA